MQNIDPLFILTPVVVLTFSAGTVLYWAFRRRFTARVFVYSLVAYAGAIALKYAVQIPTISPFKAATGGSLVALGLYYGLQTAIFEVGGAYLVASYLVRRGKIGARDSEGFGIGLAFWENGVLLAIPVLLDYVAYYVILSSPSSTAQTVYSLLAANAPSLFDPPAKALPLIGWSILERVSSLMAHFSWGILAVLAAVLRKRGYLVAAFPLGFIIDFLVPFSGRLGLAYFELVIFAVSGVWLAWTLRATRGERNPPQTWETANLLDPPEG